MNNIYIKPNKVETNNMIINGSIISLNKFGTNEIQIKRESLKALDIKEDYSSNEIIKNLEESKINFENIKSSSCYLSSTLQGFVHFIFPTAIKNYNKNSKKNNLKTIDNFDQLKNNNKFNDMIIDILKEISELQENSNSSNKGAPQKCTPSKLFESYPPQNGTSEGPKNVADCNNLHNNLQNNSLQNGNISNNFGLLGSGDDLIKIIEIYNKTIISDVMEIKFEGNRFSNLNLVLKFDKNTLKDDNLNVFKLLNNCPQLKKNDYSQNKIEVISDIIYMVVDRISTGVVEKKQFNVDEKIYFDKYNKKFTSSSYQNLLYELKFIIYHNCDGEYSGHYTAYSKINNVWYFFNDLSSVYAEKKNPPLKDNKENDLLPVIMYYLKNNN